MQGSNMTNPGKESFQKLICYRFVEDQSRKVESFEVTNAVQSTPSYDIYAYLRMYTQPRFEKQAFAKVTSFFSECLAHYNTDISCVCFLLVVISLSINHNHFVIVKPGMISIEYYNVIFINQLENNIFHNQLATT